jgi:PAS domain S-box-containing protein
MRARGAAIVQILVLAAVYLAAGRMGLRLDGETGFVTLVWAPSGIALAALLRFGRRLWPGVALGALVVNLWAGAPVMVACAIAVGNTFEPLLGALLVDRTGRPDIGRFPTALRLVLLAAGLSTMISATVGSLALFGGGLVPSARLGHAWLTWWIGDGIGDLIVAPVLLTLPYARQLLRDRRRAVEALALAPCLIAAACVIFLRAPEPGEIRLPFFVFSLVLLAALRFGPAGAAWGLLIASALAIAGTVLGRGPIVQLRSTPAQSLLALQIFTADVAATALILSALQEDRVRSALALERADAQLELARERARLASIVESSSDAIYSYDLDDRVQSWNSGAERLFGYAAPEMIGRSVKDIVPLGRRAEWTSLRERLHRGERIDQLETVCRRKDGALVEVALTFAPLWRCDGSLEGLSAIARDVTVAKAAARQLRASLKEKDVLLQEVHHRVKNNLQVITSLLRLQASAGPALREPLRESEDRIRAIALIHEQLYAASDLGRISFDDYLGVVTSQLQRIYACPAVEVEVVRHGLELPLDQAVPCGLIVNELVSNALRHAFPAGREAGHVTVSLQRGAAGRRELEVRDDGVGLAADLDIHETPTLGLRLVGMLVEQLGGSIALERRGGTRFRVRF